MNEKYIKISAKKELLSDMLEYIRKNIDDINSNKIIRFTFSDINDFNAYYDSYLWAQQYFITNDPTDVNYYRYYRFVSEKLDENLNIFDLLSKSDLPPGILYRICLS